MNISLTAVLSEPETLEPILNEARLAQSAWQKLTVAERTVFLRRLRQNLTRQTREVIKPLMGENGKSDLEALTQEIIPVLDTLTFLEKNACRILKPETLNLKTRQFYFRGKKNRLIHEPYGVIGILGTWNYPFVLSMTQILFAVAAGNSVIFKGSPESAEVTQTMQRLFEGAGFPAHLVTCFTSGVEGGEALVNLSLDKYILTGSRTTGRKVLRSLAGSLKPSVMELSGVDAYVILTDADWKLAVRTLLWGTFQYAGQTCVAPRRVFILEQDQSRFERELQGFWKENADFIRQQSRLRSEPHARIEKQKIQSLITKGARLLAGEPMSDLSSRVFGPQVYTGLQTADLKGMDFMAPVFFVMACRTKEDILQEVNASSFALGASLWTKDQSLAEAWCKEICAGQIWVNDSIFSVALGEVPFGGYRDSGFGKTRGKAGLLEMTQTRFVSFDWRRFRFPLHLPPYRSGSFGVLNAVQGFLFEPTFAGRMRALYRVIRESMKGPK